MSKPYMQLTSVETGYPMLVMKNHLTSWGISFYRKPEQDASETSNICVEITLSNGMKYRVTESINDIKHLLDV